MDTSSYLLILIILNVKLVGTTFVEEELLVKSNSQHNQIDFKDLDCNIRRLAYNFSEKILSYKTGNFKSIFDALELTSLCGDTFHPINNDIYPYIGHSTKLATLRQSSITILDYIVDSVHGSDLNAGVVSAPFKSIGAALRKCRFQRVPWVPDPRTDAKNYFCVIHLRTGTYFLNRPIQLGAEDSNILLTRYLNEEVVISGGKIVKTEWMEYLDSIKILTGENAIFEDINPGQSTNRVVYMGKYHDVTVCQSACKINITCTAFSYFDTTTGAFSQMCYGRFDGRWNTVSKSGVTSGNKIKIFVADISKQVVKPFTSMFVNDERAVRARFPNGNPELTGLHTKPTGYVAGALKWLPPKKYDPAYEIHVDSPSRQKTPFATFQTGINGSVAQFDPPKSYWATAHPAGGGGATYIVPSGLQAPEIKSRSWKHPETGIVHAFQHYHWENWIFQLDKMNQTEGTLEWSYGGFQGARGSGDGHEWYVENIFEELDSANEWFLDKEKMLLYYFPNSTKLPTEVVVPQIESVISVVGSKRQPVRGVNLMGLTLKHTTSTFLEKYEVPSGGDWTVHRNAMIYAEGTESLLVDGCTFSAPGGNGMFLSNYNRRATISNNEFFKLGDNGIVLVGSADLIDGTNGNQPRGTEILRNIIRDNGLWGKQTYSFVQSVACDTYLEGNVFFNGPRGSMNFNDGFGGGNRLYQNLLFNFVRETDDHGPINTWDRQPYITTMLDGKSPSLFPKESLIYNNFIINNFRSVWPIDHDDGTCYWSDSYNYLIYGGFKNYLGHSKQSTKNFYVYPDALPHTGASFSVPFCADTAGQSLGSAATGYGDSYTENTCILNKEDLYRLGSCNAAYLKDLIPYFANNNYYTPTGNATVTCGSNKWTIAQFQALGFDVGTKVQMSKTVTCEQIISWGKSVLGL